ncbi:MAG: imidazole glycerol phosphate synthase subunit HisH [Pyrinomonadaceae bacterium]
MRVAIVKYNAGNTASVVNALTRIGVESVVCDDAETLRQADKVIFPGVGEASSAMRYLRERKLDNVIKSLTQPVFGICLGMQLMCSDSEENDTECLGIFSARVRGFEPSNLKVPHTGWNTVHDLDSPLFAGVIDGEYLYFVHGYFVETGEQRTATCDYGVRFAAAMDKDNFHAVQFHPEKSGTAGQCILENFLKL